MSYGSIDIKINIQYRIWNTHTIKRTRDLVLKASTYVNDIHGLILTVASWTKKNTLINFATVFVGYGLIFFVDKLCIHNATILIEKE